MSVFLKGEHEESLWWYLDFDNADILVVTLYYSLARCYCEKLGKGYTGSLLFLTTACSDQSV